MRALRIMYYVSYSVWCVLCIRRVYLISIHVGQYISSFHRGKQHAGSGVHGTATTVRGSDLQRGTSSTWYL